MKNSHRFIRNVILFQFAFLLLGVKTIFGQSLIQTPVSVRVNSMIGGYYEALPSDYTSNTSRKYPLLVFLHGMGEIGDGSPSQLPLVLRNGPPKLINQGTFPSSFTVNGQSFQFIVISPQLTGRDESGSSIQSLIDYLVAKYRVDQSRIYLTGLSMGGGSVWYYTAMGGGATRLAAIANMCGNSPPYYGWAATLAKANLPVWAFHNQNDPTCPLSYTTDWISQLNAQVPAMNPTPKMTIFNAGGHDCWTTGYSPSYKENNMNVYEWMLQYSRGTTPPLLNVSPVASAGNDQTIQLPTNSVTLSGSGSDADGTVASYQWSKISGGTATFASPTSPSTNITGLTQGSYTFRLTVTDNKGAAASDDVVVTVNAATATVSYTSIPAKIEAESFSAMYGVQTESTQDAGGGQNVGWIDNGDWMDFNVNATSAGTYTLNFRVASPYGAQFQIKNNAGTVLTTVSVPNTGAFQTWKTVSASVNLPQGNQTLRIFATQPSWNINWVDFTLASGSSSTTTATTTKIEAEAYTAMYGVQTAATQDAGGGNYVGWIDNGDWMNYIISPSSEGSYTMNFRVASANTGAKFEVRNSAGTVLATVSVPNTGGYDTWQTVSATLTLPQGTQTLRLISVVSTYWNINWLDYALSSTTSTPLALSSVTTITSKVEAESFSAMYGVQTETTQDTGGGQDVGWIDNGDWMDYSVTTSAQGTYTMNLRVASLYWGGQFQIKNSAGTVLATVNVPNTGGFQSWQTVSTSVVLAQGTQTIRVYATVQPWNINWFEIVSATSSSLAAKDVSGTTQVLSDITLSSSTTQDKMVVVVSTPLTGALSLQLRDENGEVKKHFAVEKTKAQPTQLYLSLKELPKGNYTLWVEMDNWKTSKNITKQ